GRELRQFLAPDSATGDLFGFSVALCGNRAVVGALNDDDLAPDGGSAYYLREIAGPMPLMTLAKTRDFAPGVPGADFRALIDPVLNPDGETAFCATLTGSGAGRGAAAKGVWSDFGAPWSLGLVARGGGNTDLGGGVMVKTVGKPVFNRTDDLVFPGSKQGAGVTSGNDTALFRANGSTGMVNAFLSEGQTFPAFVGAELDRFFEVAQSHSGAIADAAVAFQYKKGPGGVDKFSDSGVLAIDHDGSLRDVFQEDFELDSAAQVFWAQFSPRVSITGSQMAWSAFLTGDTVTAANNQGVFRIQPGAVAETPVARKGDMLPGGKISSLLAEAIAPDNAVVYRAALTEAPKTENELLSFEGATVWNKGDLVSNFESSVPFGVRIVRLLKFWPIAGAKVIYLAKMSGPGVNKSNDCGLFLWDNAGIGDEKSQLLLREGDDACGCDCPRVGSIQRVDVEPATGKYLVLASLTGNKAANQALFAGDACGGSVTTYRALRLPVLKLRKGTAHQAALGQTTKILSLSFTETADKAGAGAKGLGQVIGLDGDVSVCVQFTNKAKELMSGKP
ncbi:MAG: FG-GAP repeat protein, partial [Verrucomicrobiae bacterium]|nr:FG-GAP repeat protein [Verrucomicrobiae bacterium]